MRGFPKIAVCFFSMILACGGIGWAQALAPAGPPVSPEAAAEIVRLQKVAALVAHARKLYEATNYREAADLLRQATIIDPQDENAALLLRLVISKLTDQEQEDNLKRESSTQPGIINGSGATRIRPFEPNPNPFIFTATSDPPVNSRLPIELDADRAVRNRLERNLREFTAENQPLEKAIIFLRDSTSINILVNWAALHEAGIEKSTPVTISLKEVPFRKALTAILSQVGGGTTTASYIVKEGAIVISSMDDLTSPKYQTVNVYDIRDMLILPPNNPAPNTGTTRPADIDPIKIRQQLVDTIIDEITKTVAPESWKDHGGKIGTIRENNGQLIITQIPDNQLAVFNLLQQLRDTRSLQIAFEARILIVSNNFLDDLPPAWNIKSPLPNATTAPGAPGAAARPDFQATIIDNWTLGMLLNASQADKRTIAFTVPRCTIINGMQGHLTGATPQRYISGYPAKPVPIEAPAYAAEFATTDTGLYLTLQPTTTQDRRTVIMQFEITRRILTRMDHPPAPNVPADAKLFIDQPVISTTTGKFNFTIPDGGTALINAGLVWADFLPNPQSSPDPNPAKDDRIMLILLRPNIIMMTTSVKP